MACSLADFPRGCPEMENGPMSEGICEKCGQRKELDGRVCFSCRAVRARPPQKSSKNGGTNNDLTSTGAWVHSRIGARIDALVHGTKVLAYWVLAGLLIVIIGIVVVDSVGTETTQILPGSHCRVSRAIYGTRDLDKAYDELEKAQEVNDEYGLAELTQRDVAILLSGGTHGLVIESDFFAHLSFYRKVRILDGPYAGKALWVRMNALEADPGTQAPAPQASDGQPPVAQPSIPETCRDPHERLGSTGVCFCEPGYKRDATTLKCVQ